MEDQPQGWHRRQALQIASQLPDNPDDAWAILEIVGDLVRFFAGPDPKPPDGGDDDHAVLRFPGGPSSPRRWAKSTERPPGRPK